EECAERLLRFGYFAEPEEGGGRDSAEIGGRFTCRNCFKDGERLLALALAKQSRCLDEESLPVLRFLSEDERRLRLRFLPRSDLDRGAPQVGGKRQRIRAQLLGPLELSEGVAIPGLGRIGTAKPLDGRHEVLIDLQGIPELDDGLVGLAVLHVFLSARQSPLLLGLGSLGARHGRHQGEPDDEQDPPGATILANWFHRETSVMLDPTWTRRRV